MARLIITEKNIAARRIAEILSGGKFKVEKSFNLPIYVFKDGESEIRCFGLKGHILKADFPKEYQNWQQVNPKELINAKIVKVPTQMSVLKVLKKEGSKARTVILATDFDREGELIGIDAFGEIKKINSKIDLKRARFSALNSSEIKKAFSHLEQPYFNLALAGEARQDIDLIWGATLTRFISLASSRLGKQFLSVGRVQSPTLCLIAQREKEIKSFVPVPYWQLKGLFEHGSEKFWANHKVERFWKKEEAEEIKKKLGDEGIVKSIVKSKKILPPPTPFNTTTFLTSAASLGISPARSMRIAENLYMNGLISYPRVDNTVYPESLNLGEVLKVIQGNQVFGYLAKELLSLKQLTPTRGKKEATDHPPIYPTGLAQVEDLKKEEWKVYELVARRFLATLSSPAVVESARVEIEVNEEIFIIRGIRVVKEGWFLAYPYGRKKDEEIPLLKEGDIVRVIEIKLEEKETQPPLRYSQGRLIQKMEELNLGTKATRHQIIQNLYDRLYIQGDPIVPTELGMAVSEALLKHMEPISTPQMTAELEREMDRIAEGKSEKKEVVEHSRTMLAKVMNLLESRKREVRAEIKEGVRGDKIVGKCPNCQSELRIIRARKTKKRFVGCSNYPQCSTSFPLPQSGEVLALNEVCEICLSPKVKLIRKGKKPWVICINPNCQSKENFGGKDSA